MAIQITFMLMLHSRMLLLLLLLKEFANFPQ